MRTCILGITTVVALAAMAILANSPRIASADSNSLLASCRFVKISSNGFNTTLAVTDDGHVVGWGVNGYSKTDGLFRTATNVEWAGSLVGIPNLDNVIDVEATSASAMVLRSDGTLWSWGYNTDGILGDGTMLDSAVPVPVVGLDNVVDFDLGYPSVALRSDGTVWAWGDNSLNQIGMPSPPTEVLVPTQIPTLSGVTAIASGYGFTLALLGDGTVRAWGRNEAGNLGIGTTTTSEIIPVQPIGLSGVVAVEVAGSALALKADGTLWWWGYDTGSTVPVQVAGLPPIKLIGRAFGHIMVAAVDGTFWTWGDPNMYGQAGNGNKITVATPVQMINLVGDVSDFGGEFNSTAAVMADGTLRVSGIGSAPQNDEYKPKPIPGIDNVVDISAATFNGFAVKSDGSLWGWGGNEAGELGIGTRDDSWSPTQIIASGVADVEAGDFFTLARFQNGTVAAWGRNSDGQLGDGSTINRLAPVVNPFLAGVTAVAAGTNHALAVLQDGTMQAWGRNNDGELGTGDKVSSTTPLPVSGLTDVQAVAAGDSISYAIKADGTLWWWGKGRGVVPSQVTLPAPERVLAIRARRDLSIFLTETGVVYSGGTYYKERWHDFLGRCPGRSWSVPAMQGAVSIGQSESRPYAVLSDGTVITWGRNLFGSLGTQKPGVECDPVPVLDLANVAQMDGGMGNTIALHRDGTLSSWGWNFQGGLGNGTSSSSLVHVEPIFERVPLPQGNLIRAARSGADVRLSFHGGTGPAWRIYRDAAKEVMGTTALVPDSVGLVFDDVGAVRAPDSYFYQVRGATVCGGLLGP